jgi:hypothetical protein
MDDGPALPGLFIGDRRASAALVEPEGGADGEACTAAAEGDEPTAPIALFTAAAETVFTAAVVVEVAARWRRLRSMTRYTKPSSTVASVCAHLRHAVGNE